MSATNGDLVALIRSIVEQHLIDRFTPFSGIVMNWDPSTGTVHVWRGDTLGAMDGSDPDAEALVHTPIPLLTRHVSDQSGPIGGERCIVFPYDGGYFALLHNGKNDSPGAPAGESWLGLRSFDANLAAQCFARVQVDATRVGHAQKVVVKSPQFLVGMEQSVDGKAVVRKEDLQQAMDELTKNVQSALNTGFNAVQAGTGAPAPTVAKATANASETAYTE